MKWFVRGLGAVALVLVVLVVVVLVRTFNYGPSSGPDTASVELPQPPTVYGDRIAENVGAAIRFRTITLTGADPRPGQEGPWLELHDWMIATYPAVHREMTREVVPGTLTLLYTWEGSDPSLPPLLLMAHQDVVPVNIGTEGDWTAPPFSGEVVDGILYGRGTIDDKSSMVALLEAAEALIEEGFEPRRTIIFLFGHNEEVSGSGARDAVALLKSRDVAPLMALDEGYMIVSPSPLTGKPMGLIGVAEKGYLTLVITAEAEGGHSSTPPRDSAAVIVSKAVVRLDANQMPADLSYPIVQDLFRELSPDMSFTAKMAMANLWLFKPFAEKEVSKLAQGNAMIRTTTAPTMLQGSAKENVLAQRAMAVVNFRVHPKDTPEMVMEHVEKLLSDLPGISVAVGEDGIDAGRASPVSSTDSRAYAVIEAVAKRTGDNAPVVPGLVLGATDARWAAAITSDVYRFTPAVMSPEELTGFHGTNERISVENLQRMVEGYALVMMVLASE